MTIKTVLITGALAGIGRATAFAFAEGGYHLSISGCNAATGASLEAELRALGAKAEFIAADVRFEDNVRRLVEETIARFGALDAAVTNAGTEAGGGPIIGQTVEQYAATFDTNVLGMFLSLKHELRVMQPQGYGSIINLSSTMGHRGAANASLYVASKHAVEGLTKAAAQDRACPTVERLCPSVLATRRRTAIDEFQAGSLKPSFVRAATQTS